MSWEYYSALKNYDNLHFLEQKEKILRSKGILLQEGLEFKGKGLDIGSGTSAFYRIVGGDVVNLEPSDLVFLGSGKRIQGRGEELFFKKEYFDYCCSWTALHHCDLERVRSEVKKVLKKDGFWIFSFFKRAEKLEEFRRLFKGKEFDLGLDILRIGRWSDL